MKSFINGLILTLFLTQFSFAQWYLQSSGTTNPLHSSFFINDLMGWVVGAEGTIRYTTNGGNNWYSQTSETTNHLFSVYFVSSTEGWAIGIYGLILHTTDGGTNWDAQISGTTNHLESVFFVSSTEGWIVGTGGEILHTTNGGTNWNSQTSGTWNDLRSIYFTSPDFGWAVGYLETVLHTTNRGEDWIILTTGTSNYTSCSVYFISPNEGWIAATNLGWDDYGKILHTTDGGINWNIQKATFFPLRSVTFVSPAKGWAVGWGGAILYTSNGGNNWTYQTSGTTKYLFSISFLSESMGWAVGEGGTILKTINGGILPVELHSFSASSNDGDVKLIWSTATETNNHGFEIQRKKDGSTWVTIGFKEGKGTTTELQLYSFNDKYLSSGKYSYRLKQIDFDGSFDYSRTIEIDINIPLVYSLLQNYPNPFNPTTTINYSIPQSSHIQVKVFDVLGKEMATLVNEEKPAGKYELTWNAKNLTSGVYFYQLKAGDFIQTKKMILIK